MIEKAQEIYTSTTEGAFEEMLRSTLLQVDAVGLIKLVIFSKPSDDTEYKQNLKIIDEVVKEIFGDLPPLTSYIAQKTSHGGITVEATYITTSDTKIEHHRNFKLITIGGCTELMTGGIVPRFDGGSKILVELCNAGLFQRQSESRGSSGILQCSIARGR